VLGGEIKIESREDRGSTFTLFLPQNYTAPPMERRLFVPRIEEGEETRNGETPSAEPAEFAVADDRGGILPGDKAILIIEDDRDFAQWVADLTHAHGFKTIVTSRGARALELVRQFPPVAVILDLSLPDITGWKV